MNPFFVLNLFTMAQYWCIIFAQTHIVSQHEKNSDH